MHSAETLLFKGRDQYGDIFVNEEGEKRFLGFATHDEQSAWSKAEPLIPQHDYIRNMLLVLLWANPKQIISLGLGAGIINSVLFHRFPQSKQQVVELRQQVIDVAYKYFQLPMGKRLNIHHDDAFAFIQQADVKKADIIFSDIYDAKGLNDIQLHNDYLLACHSKLKHEGWLVLNCWRHHQSQELIKRLSDLFSQIHTVDTPSGNWIVFASNTPKRLSNKALKDKSKDLNALLGFSLSSHLNRLKDIKS